MDVATNAPPPLECSAVLTHHWLVRRRGGERVLEALRELLPDAPIYTLVHDPAGMRAADEAPAGLSGSTVWRSQAALIQEQVHTSFLQYIPGSKRHYPKLLPLMPLAARRMRLPAVDLVVCSDAALAKAMTPHARSRVVCYCHSPMRYVWDLSELYRATLPAPLRPLWGPLVRWLRDVDRAAAQRVHQFVANSQHVAERIRRCYGRESVVIHPPVDLPPAPASGPRGDFYLCVGHHVPYKRLDLAVDACRRLGRRLVVIGEGPDLRRLRTPANPHVQFLGWQPDAVVADHYRRARALLFPGEEDFGLVPVEAQGHGCPVVAYGVGGVCETVVHGRTGVLFGEQTVEALAAAIGQLESLHLDPDDLHAHAQQFSRANFLGAMRTLLQAAHAMDSQHPLHRA